MTLETKFNIGDKVYVLDTVNTAIKEATISLITVSTGTHIPTKIIYSTEEEIYLNFTEDQLYSTREELIEKLKFIPEQ